MKKNIKIIIAILGVVVTMLLLAVAILYDPNNEIVGNNLNSSMFVKEIQGKEYPTIEAAMAEEVVEEIAAGGNSKDMTLLYQGTTKKLEKLFWLETTQNGEITFYQIKGYEFLVNQNGSYSYAGVKSRVFNYTLQEAKYDWKTTVLADLSDSIHKSYQEVLNVREVYGVLPAWGVSDSEQVTNMTIDGQEVDHVIEFVCNDKKYFLWMIDDLQTQKDITDIIIDVKK